ncbi:hypothetical protein GCM10008020_11580 [Massilia psychrophila]|nr:hypothetical protein GCM10008020_11580 [Massilia psychrophila]
MQCVVGGWRWLLTRGTKPAEDKSGKDRPHGETGRLKIAFARSRACRQSQPRKRLMQRIAPVDKELRYQPYARLRLPGAVSDWFNRRCSPGDLATALASLWTDYRIKATT